MEHFKNIKNNLLKNIKADRVFYRLFLGSSFKDNNPHRTHKNFVLFVGKELQIFFMIAGKFIFNFIKFPPFENIVTNIILFVNLFFFHIDTNHTS